MLKKMWLYYFMEISILYFGIVITNPLIGDTYLAQPDEFPFIVSLSYLTNVTDKDNHFCGGALISKRHVLTADHCINRDNLFTEHVGVVVGTLNFQSGHIYRVESWITYTNWALSNHRTPPRATKNDVAVVTLSHDVPNIKPAKISSLHYCKVLGKDVVTAGWGLIDEAKDIVPDSLLKANLKVLNAAQTKRYHRKLYGKSVKPKTYFYYTAANPPAVLTCGDSGGPLLLASTKEIVGINQASCDIKDPLNNPYAMSRHLKLLDEYKEFIGSVLNE